MSIIRVTKKYTVIYDFRALRGLRGRFRKEILSENAAFCNKFPASLFSFQYVNELCLRVYGADIAVYQRLTTFRVFPAMHPKSSILLRIRRLRGIGLRHLEAMYHPEAVYRPEAFCLSGTPPSGQAGRDILVCFIYAADTVLLNFIMIFSVFV